MDSVEQLTGTHDGSGLRFGIAAATFNEGYVERLLAAAVEFLLGHGVAASDLVVARVPGAWELPQAIGEMARGRAGHFDALIALGVVIRGETPHFDYLCQECSRGLGVISNEERIPVALGVLTCDDASQAEDRCGGRVGNKGTEAALAALEMATLLRALPEHTGGD
ncbi:MAG: 6,7-dimethyl-8-ribityllumazine synthase [Acidobacteriota bacterium]|nr:6,7-dimethyl-8-ribityllumazine synthase [Acidobacteriota bacterium]